MHVNTLSNAAGPGDELDASPEGRLAIAQSRAFAMQESGYLSPRGTESRTVGYGLADSARGLLSSRSTKTTGGHGGTLLPRPGRTTAAASTGRSST